MAALPPLWVNLLRVWLTAFLGVVGYMKGSGQLWHPLSTLAGPIELFGAILQLPLIFGSLKQKWSVAGSHTLSVLGCHCFTFALGLILSTHKRKGVVCWAHAVLTVVYLHSLRPSSDTRRVDLNNPLRNCLAAVYFLVLAVAAGIMFQANESLFNGVNEACPVLLMFLGLVVLPYTMMPL